MIHEIAVAQARRPSEVYRAHKRHLACNVRPACDPARERRPFGWRQLRREIIQSGARPVER